MPESLAIFICNFEFALVLHLLSLCLFVRIINHHSCQLLYLEYIILSVFLIFLEFLGHGFFIDFYLSVLVEDLTNGFFVHFPESFLVFLK